MSVAGISRIFYAPNAFTKRMDQAVNELPDRTIDVLWDGGSLLAVNKPHGLSTQAPKDADSLETRLRAQLHERASYLAFPHRLDRPVSGVILVALTKRAARLLSEQFASRKPEKIYQAIIHGKIECADDTIWSDWLLKIPDQPQVAVVTEETGGAKLAETHVDQIGYAPASDHTHLRLKPLTGRMHQLRIQAANRGFPIVGDALYGTEEESADRIFLHAHSIRFHEPTSGKLTTVKSAIPWLL